MMPINQQPQHQYTTTIHQQPPIYYQIHQQPQAQQFPIQNNTSTSKIPKPGFYTAKHNNSRLKSFFQENRNRPAGIDVPSLPQLYKQKIVIPEIKKKEEQPPQQIYVQQEPVSQPIYTQVLPIQYQFHQQQPYPPISNIQPQRPPPPLSSPITRPLTQGTMSVNLNFVQREAESSEEGEDNRNHHRRRSSSRKKGNRNIFYVKKKHGRKVVSDVAEDDEENKRLVVNGVEYQKKSTNKEKERRRERSIDKTKGEKQVSSLIGDDYRIVKVVQQKQEKEEKLPKHSRKKSKNIIRLSFDLPPKEISTPLNNNALQQQQNLTQFYPYPPASYHPSHHPTCSSNIEWNQPPKEPQNPPTTSNIEIQTNEDVAADSESSVTDRSTKKKIKSRKSRKDLSSASSSTSSIYSASSRKRTKKDKRSRKSRQKKKSKSEKSSKNIRSRSKHHRKYSSSSASSSSSTHSEKFVGEKTNTKNPKVKNTLLEAMLSSAQQALATSLLKHSIDCEVTPTGYVVGLDASAISDGNPNREQVHKVQISVTSSNGVVDALTSPNDALCTKRKSILNFINSKKDFDHDDQDDTEEVQPDPSRQVRSAGLRVTITNDLAKNGKNNSSKLEEQPIRQPFQTAKPQSALRKNVNHSSSSSSSSSDEKSKPTSKKPTTASEKPSNNRKTLLQIYPTKLKPCKICERRFKSERLSDHERICEKSHQKRLGRGKWKDN